MPQAGTTRCRASAKSRNPWEKPAAGRILGVTATAGGESWTYGYDDMDRLTSATNATDPLLTQSWTYDSVDNMTYNSAVGAYSYPAPGTPRPHGVTSTPLGTYVYDANGNMVSAAGDTLVYDGENRPVSVNAVTFARSTIRSGWINPIGESCSSFNGVERDSPIEPVRFDRITLWARTGSG